MKHSMDNFDIRMKKVVFFFFWAGLKCFVAGGTFLKSFPSS